jgi:hypothetical protein
LYSLWVTPPSAVGSLQVAGGQHFPMAHAVLVLEGTIEDVGEDLHVAVRVGGEAAAGGDAVLVDDPELAKAHMVGIVVVPERERVARVQPPEVEPPTVLRFPYDDHFIAFKRRGRRGSQRRE